jgi:hypothetical protein
VVEINNTDSFIDGANLKEEFNKVRQALEEHLNSINDNSNEIQALFDYLQEMDAKFEKLCQRLDNLQLEATSKPLISPLNKEERKVFLALYTEETPLSFVEIAVKANLPKSIVPDCVSALTNKGIPLQRSFYNDRLFLKLDPNFKEMQAKENLINVSLDNFM